MTAPASHPRLTLVLGGQRSGKSAHAEALCEALIVDDAVYLATCRAGQEDADMAARIRRHRDRRGDRWVTVEEPFDLAGAIASESVPGRPLLIDSLGMWVTNLLEAERDVDAAIDGLLKALDGAAGPVVAVSEETGLGVIPDNALARAFVDALGQANQQVAGSAARVVLVTAGIPKILKS